MHRGKNIGVVSILKKHQSKPLAFWHLFSNWQITAADEKILTILTYVGLSLSIAGLILTIIAYARFRWVAKMYNKRYFRCFDVYWQKKISFILQIGLQTKEIPLKLFLAWYPDIPRMILNRRIRDCSRRNGGKYATQHDTPFKKGTLGLSAQ